MRRNATAPSCEVAVVGAGPAGATAAIHLAERGSRVFLLEKSTMPRYKTCGGGLTARARRLLPLDLSAVVERECRAVEVCGKGVSYRVERPEPLIVMTMRDRLDLAIAAAAQRAGATLMAGCEVLGLEQFDGKVVLRTTNGPLEARFVVAADGVLSRVARSSGFADLRQLAPALECELVVAPSEFERLSLQARFDVDLLLDGYGWVFPKAEHLSVGVASRKRGQVRLHQLLEHYYRKLGIRRIEREERHGSLIPIGPRRGGLVKGRVLLSGDAAGLADPLTLEGISAAITSGRLAAEALAQSAFKPRDVARHYSREVFRRIVSEHRRASLLSRLLSYYPRLLRHCGSPLAEGLADVFSGDRSYHDIFTARGAVRLLLSA